MRHSAPRALRASGAAASIQTQCVLYKTSVAAITRSLEYHNNAARLAHDSGVVSELIVAYGDCSPEQTLDAETLHDLRHRFDYLADIEYTYFSKNLGSAAGHNRLLENASADLVMIANPDILIGPGTYLELLAVLDRPGVGLAEARQLPIEHPKFYDPQTGETSWGSTACLIGPTPLFRQLKGFDAETFFLYCDDVDVCWRARLVGCKVVHQPSAVVHHDKRLNRDGGWISSLPERYYSAEARLLLTYKYSRADLTERYLGIFP
jgi:GT2 family glycosyltransferase